MYPPRLKLHRLTIQPAVSLGINEGRSAFIDQRFLLITRSDIDEFRGGREPVETYRGPLGEVNVWRVKKPREFLHPLVLHLQVSDWSILVGEDKARKPITRRYRRLWAKNLGAHVTDSGFIVIEPSPPLTFATQEPGTPNLYLSECFRFLELRLQRCQDLRTARLAKNQYSEVVRGTTVHRSRSGRQFYANWCTPSRHIEVYVDDRDRSFVDLAVRHLRVRDVSLSPEAKSMMRGM